MSSCALVASCPLSLKRWPFFTLHSSLYIHRSSLIATSLHTFTLRTLPFTLRTHMPPSRKMACTNISRITACANMFSIPELFDLVCSQLDRSSLVRCAQLNKEWSLNIPRHVWRTIPKDMSAYRWCQLRHLVLEDYLLEIRQQEKQQPQMLQQPAKKLRQSLRLQKSVTQPLEPCKTEPLALDKHRHWVRRVDGFAQLLRGLEPMFVGRSEFNRWDYLGPSAMTLAWHFLRRCPNVLLHLQISHECAISAEKFGCALEILPKVDSLVRSFAKSRSTCTP